MNNPVIVKCYLEYDEMGDSETDLDTTIEMIDKGEEIMYFQFLIFIF